MRGTWAVIVVAGTLLVTACASSATSSGRRPLLARDVERLVDETVARPIADRRFAGVVLVTQNGRPLLRKAYGFADHEQRIAATPSTGFMVMSVSKQFTAALIARLVVKGRLSFDDRVGVSLDDWPPAWGDVTVGNLLAHSSGLPIDTTYAWLVKHHPEYWAEPGVTPPPYQPRPLETPPGTTYNYANVGYTLLSMIAARAGGLPFDELMRREVFGPLGLHDTIPSATGASPDGRAGTRGPTAVSPCRSRRRSTSSGPAISSRPRTTLRGSTRRSMTTVFFPLPCVPRCCRRTSRETVEGWAIDGSFEQPTAGG